MPRTIFALAADGFLPRAIAVVHSRYHSPHVAILVQSILALALAISNTFESLAILANVSALALYFGCALAAWRLQRVHAQTNGTAFRVPLPGIVPWLTCAVIVWLLTGLTGGEWLAFGACVAGASLVYISTRSLALTPSRSR
jgi:amino acid transporter